MIRKSWLVACAGPGDQLAGGASFKIVQNTDDWDASVGLNNPGQSGDVNSRHYRDLCEYWARGKYFPVFFSRPKIASVAEMDTTLSPEFKAGR